MFLYLVPWHSGNNGANLFASSFQTWVCKLFTCWLSVLSDWQTKKSSKLCSTLVFKSRKHNHAKPYGLCLRPSWLQAGCENVASSVVSPILSTHHLANFAPQQTILSCTICSKVYQVILLLSWIETAKLWNYPHFQFKPVSLFHVSRCLKSFLFGIISWTNFIHDVLCYAQCVCAHKCFSERVLVFY